MKLSDKVCISRRFQRSINIDADLDSIEALKGFICPKSSAEVLVQFARHIKDVGQGAFTWTGPYGSGKSSLAVILSALLGKDKQLGKIAKQSLPPEITSAVLTALPPGDAGWTIVPVLGRRANPLEVITKALENRGIIDLDLGYREDQLTASLLKAAQKDSHSGGIVVIIDEMGKFLEAAAHRDTDVYLFQLLAEAASRSGSRLILIGILHQSFHEYASRLSRELRDEWSKIQGRFVDLTVNAAGEEQIELIAQAIICDEKTDQLGELAETIATAIQQNRKGISKHLAVSLKETWPLHPVVACLLGPISRRRFGQNQRSIFGFLNSAEPHGFQDFLHHAQDSEMYRVDVLWDYLRVNLEPSILASPDGHRWALAVEALERCDANGGGELELKLLKAIALIDLFKERSGLLASAELASLCYESERREDTAAALEKLRSQSYVIYRNFNNSYAIFAGSDFDIELALESALSETRTIDFAALKHLAGLQPILAKRYYHETGSMWWFDVEMAPLSELAIHIESHQLKPGTAGIFLLGIPTEGEDELRAEEICNSALQIKFKGELLIGISPRSWTIISLARELLGLERVLSDRPELAGDAVARREIKARIAQLQNQLEAELSSAFDNAEWFHKKILPQVFPFHELNSFASRLVTEKLSKSPRIHNELLNRIKPSSSANAAKNFLLRHMVMHESEKRLGIEGFPAEGGLYDSLLAASKLHQETPDGWRFVAPLSEIDDPCRLRHVWSCATDLLQKKTKEPIPIAEIFNKWRKHPYGVKDGIMPVLAVAYIQSMKANLAIYRQGVFQAKFKDLDVEYLAKDASDIQLRWMDLSEVSKKLLSGLAEAVRTLDTSNSLKDLQPIDVARGLITIFDRLQPWAKRTMHLSGNARQVRDLFKQASDPNKFIFDDIPAVFGYDAAVIDGSAIEDSLTHITEGLTELCEAYPKLLQQFQHRLLSELKVPNDSNQSLAELRERAENIRKMSGDYRIDGFIDRVACYNGSDEQIEGIAGLSINKPPQNWIDLDIDKALIEVTALAEKFIRLEMYARVKGRENKRHSMSVVVGVDQQPTPISAEFDIAEADRSAIDAVIATVEQALSSSDKKKRNVILAALAELSARYIQQTEPKQGVRD